MDVNKILETVKEKKWIVLAVAILVLILLLILLLHSCGGNGNANVGGNENSDGGATNATTTIAPPATEEISYDDDLISTWYKSDATAMVIAEDGNGSLYYGDEDGGEFRWYTAGNRLTIVSAEKTSVATYAISGDTLTLTYSDGTVETWER